ncbi:MAG: sensor histidine kinase [Thermotogota bacterium]
MSDLINYKNRNLISILIIFYVIITFSIFFSYSKSMENIIKNRDLYIINNLAEKNPEIETEIVNTFKNAQRSNNTDIINNYNISEEYSFQNEGFNAQRNKSIFYLIIISTFIGIIIFIFQDKVFKDIEKKLYKLIHYIDKAMNLEFEFLDEKNEEGAIYLLYTQFNLMARRYNNNLEKMKENHHYLKDLIYNLSHQLKTPISSIKIFNEIMIDEKDYKEEKTEEFLLKSKKQINKIEWIIKKMFEISKIENDDIRFKKELVNLNDLIEEIIINFQHIISDKNLQIIYDVKSNADILLDKNMIKEALSNVIENALKYSFKNENIILSVFEEKSNLIFSVKDKGIIIESSFNKIFSKFYRSKDAKTKNPEGTGLGLAFAKVTIEKNNGEISYKSNPDCTEFIIKFQK